MATYTSDQITVGSPIAGPGAGGGQERIAHFRVDVPIGATTTDFFNLCYLPPDAMVVGGVVKYDALGSGTLQIGDLGGGLSPVTGTTIAAAQQRYFSNLNTTATGSSASMVNAGLFFKTGKIKVMIQAVFTAGTTTTAGAVEGVIRYTIEEPQQ